MAYNSPKNETAFYKDKLIENIIMKNKNGIVNFFKYTNNIWKIELEDLKLQKKTFNNRNTNLLASTSSNGRTKINTKDSFESLSPKTQKSIINPVLSSDKYNNLLNEADECNYLTNGYSRYNNNLK